MYEGTSSRVMLEYGLASLSMHKEARIFVMYGRIAHMYAML